MEKPDYFAAFRPMFNLIVNQQQTDSELQLVHFRFMAPVEEVAQIAKFARIIIDAGPGESNERLSVMPLLVFVIKMFDGIVDKSVDPLQLDFTAANWEREYTIIAIREIIKARLESSDNSYANEWADALIIINSFVKRIENYRQD
jgi:hypothetical protein